MRPLSIISVLVALVALLVILFGLPDDGVPDQVLPGDPETVLDEIEAGKPRLKRPIQVVAGETTRVELDL